MKDADEKLRRLAYLDAMGVQVWQGRDTAPVQVTETEAADVVDAEEVPNLATSVASAGSPTWEGLQAQVAACQQCELHQQRTQTVFGVGNRQAQWLIIGEAPGADEDRQGEPFVGRAGQLLNLMLQAIGLKREAVYIANIVKCRPPNNRDPKQDEVAACSAYLKAQIELIQPEIILAVGRVAAHNLLHTNDKVGALRGHRHRYEETNIPVVVTYHPAYLLRSPQEKRKAWDDLLFARQLLSAQ